MFVVASNQTLVQETNGRDYDTKHSCQARGREKEEIALPVPGPPPAKEKEEVPSATKSKSREALLCLLGDGHALAEPVGDGGLGLGRCEVALAVDVGKDGPHDGAVEHLCAL